MVIVIVIGVPLAVVALIVLLYFRFGWVREKRRREALGRLAGPTGMRFSRRDTLGLPRRLSGVKVLGHGRFRKARNLLYGQYQGREIVICDCTCATGRRLHRRKDATPPQGATTAESFSVCIHPLDVVLPDVIVRPEEAEDKMQAFFGFEDINFESDEFSRAFYVKGVNEKFAYDLIHPRMMELLLENPTCHLQLSGGFVLVSTGHTWEPESIPGVLDFVVKFLDLIPEYVWREYRAEPTQASARKEC